MAKALFNIGAERVGRGTRTAADATDERLLKRFARHRDEAAFADLVRRHGPMVLGVCRRVLHNAHDAEDAFQATFLVLVRKTGALARPELLANWLYGVAYRTALNARAGAARRRACERPAADVPVEVTPDVDWHDLRPVLDEEVNRLPDRYRVPFVLCYLQGLTNEEASARLRCPKGTVLSRLARARERLQSRLARRGLAPSAGLVAVLLTEEIASAAPSAALTDSTTRAAMQWAAGKAATAGAASARVATLTAEILRAMFLAKLKTGGLLILSLALVIGGAALLRVGAGAVETPRPQASDASRDEDNKELQGTWYTVSVESHGRKVPVERILAKDVRLVIASDRWTLKETQGDADKEFTVRRDPAQKPKAIDIVHKNGPNKGKTSLGIYELAGGTLRVCVAEPGDPRPTKFDGGGAYTLEVFKREKPKAADPAPGGPI